MATDAGRTSAVTYCNHNAPISDLGIALGHTRHQLSELTVACQPAASRACAESRAAHPNTRGGRGASAIGGQMTDATHRREAETRTRTAKKAGSHHSSRAPMETVNQVTARQGTR